MIEVGRGPRRNLLGHSTSIHLKHFDRALPMGSDRSHQLPLGSASIYASLALALACSSAAAEDECAELARKLKICRGSPAMFLQCKSRSANAEIDSFYLPHKEFIRTGKLLQQRVLIKTALRTQVENVEKKFC